MSEIVNFFAAWGVWAWLSVGLLLMIAELFIPGTFVMWFGFGAILTGLVVSLCLGIFVYGKVFGPNKEKGNESRTGAQRLIGKTFIVSEAIQNGKGKVAVGDLVWLARAKRKIAKGTEVVVVGVDGTQLLIEEKE